MAPSDETRRAIETILDEVYIALDDDDLFLRSTLVEFRDRFDRALRLFDSDTGRPDAA